MVLAFSMDMMVSMPSVTHAKTSTVPKSHAHLHIGLWMVLSGVGASPAAIPAVFSAVSHILSAVTHILALVSAIFHAV